MARVDLSGQRLGRLRILEPTPERKHGAVVWRCRCDCGNEVFLESRLLKPGVTYSCGCERRPYENIRDLTGLRFGRLTVVEKSDHRTKDRNPLWRCRCDCGNEVEVSKGKLISGNVSSCGCGRTPPPKDLVGKRFGRAVVLEYAGKEKGRQMWRCRCDCGREFTVCQSNLQDGQTTSCGCKKKERAGLHFAEGTFVEGIQSKTVSQANTSGVRGVYYNKKRSKWIAQIMFKGKCYYLGGYEKLEEAAMARARGEEMFDDFLTWYRQEYGGQDRDRPLSAD